MTRKVADITAARAIPFSFARANQILLADHQEDRVTLYATISASVDAISEVRRFFSAPVHIDLIEQVEFDRMLNEVYSKAEGSAAAVVGEIEGDFDLSSLMQEVKEVQDLIESDDDAPIIRMINVLFSQAMRDNASDIHIEPFERSSVVRFRIDGVLRDIVSPKRELHAALISRIKIMAQLDIAEKRLPQDGRISLRLAGKPVDVRVSTLPTGHGERAVLRLLDKEAGRLELTKLGMAEDTLTEIDHLIHQPHGIILVTGPTGSGKSTTLYAALSRIDSKQLNVMTVEDPIEYDLDGVGQTQVNAKIDMTFAKALRSILRQDPDVIMIGEIRDLETAQIAVQSSLTGHLVLATLHTNDAVSALGRLVDIGVESYLLASSLLGVLAQRLVRCLCPDCKKSYRPTTEENQLMEFSVPLKKVYRPVGCETCRQTGYVGRTGIHELVVIDDKIRTMIHNQTPEQEIRTYASSLGQRTLRQDGQRLLKEGITSIEEILRVTRD